MTTTRCVVPKKNAVLSVSLSTESAPAVSQITASLHLPHVTILNVHKMLNVGPAKAACSRHNTASQFNKSTACFDNRQWPSSRRPPKWPKHVTDLLNCDAMLCLRQDSNG